MGDFGDFRQIKIMGPFFRVGAILQTRTGQRI